MLNILLKTFQYLLKLFFFYIFVFFLSFFSSDPSTAWPTGNQGGQTPQSLSVVTTVWGVTQTTQSGPFTHSTPGYTNTTMSTPNYTQQPQSFAGGQMQKAAFNQQTMPYRRDSANYSRPR